VPSDLTCQELVELITEYLDGALPPEEVRRFEAHLAGCRGCRAYLGQVRRTIRVAGHLTEGTVPDGPKQRLLSAFRAWKAGPDSES
jgi:anti-sigma factor RsiW